MYLCLCNVCWEEINEIRKKMNGFVAREYFYRELSWSHNKVPYAFILIRGYTSGGFLESPGNVSGLTPNITCFYLLTSCIIFKAIKNSILNANKIACQGSVITGTFEKRACK